jgi:hypothetical protein
MTDFRKTAIILAVTAMMGSYAAPVQAKGFLEEWFPFLFEDKAPDSVPAGNGTVAPFQNTAPVLGEASQHGEEYKPADAVQGTAPQQGVAYTPQTGAEGAVTLDQPHRQPSQVETWASRVIPDVLDFDSAKYDEHIAGLNKVLTPYAIDAVKTFMAKDNLLAALQSNNLVMRAFVTEPSRLLNQGAVQNRYRWLVETPATITFLPRGTMDYKGIQPKSQRINVRLQIGRVEQGGDEGMIIETIEFIPVAAPK